MNQFTDLVRKYATKYNLAFEIVCGLIERESGWNPWTIRFEPAFYQDYIVPLLNSKRIVDITEAEARALSWGLMQVMGETAREFGYSGPFAKLCDPDTGLDIGCKVLANKLRSAQTLETGLLRWNGGSNPAYGKEVIALSLKYATPGPVPSTADNSGTPATASSETSEHPATTAGTSDSPGAPQ